MCPEELQVGAEYPIESVTAVNGEGKTVLSSVTEAMILRKRENRDVPLSKSVPKYIFEG